MSHLLEPQSSKPLLVELLLALLLVRDVVAVLVVLALLPKPAACLGGGESIPFGGARRPPVDFTPLLAALVEREGPKPSSPSSWLFFLVFCMKMKKKVVEVIWRELCCDRVYVAYNLDFDLLAFLQAEILHRTHRNFRELTSQLLALKFILELIQRNVEIERIIAFIKGNANERMSALGVGNS